MDFAKTSASTKALGTQELVYARIIKIEELDNKDVIHWEHATSGRAKVITHEVTRDKLGYDNCYGQLEVGCTYIIMQQLVKKQPPRWIWHSAKMVSERVAKIVAEKCGFHFGNMLEDDSEHFDRLHDVLVAINAQQKPKRNKTLDDLAGLIEF